MSGPRLAVTAAIHGDEVTGVSTAISFVESIDPKSVIGDIIVAPLLNPVGFFRFTRGGSSGQDINRSFQPKTMVGEEMFYADKLFTLLGSFELDYHVDLHTATSRYDNSFYVRADLQSDVIDNMARIIQPDIILNTTLPQKSLRSAMTSINVSSVTVEMGGPNKVFDRYLKRGIGSLHRLANKLGMIAGAPDEVDGAEPIVCSSSAWVCSTHSGLIHRIADIHTMVKEGDPIAEIRDVFGNFVANVVSPHDGIVIGNTERLPVSCGTRLVHVGRVSP